MTVDAAEADPAADFDWGDEASTFGDRLALAREHAEMDQTQLARRLGVKVATIRNWEADRSEPRANRLQMLSGLLAVSIVWLMTGEGEGAPAVPDADHGEEMRDLLAEMRSLRVAQTKLAERTGRIEKRLRAVLAGE